MDGGKSLENLSQCMVGYSGRKEFRLMNSKKMFPHNVTLNDKKDV